MNGWRDSVLYGFRLVKYHHKDIKQVVNSASVQVLVAKFCANVSLIPEWLWPCCGWWSGRGSYIQPYNRHFCTNILTCLCKSGAICLCNNDRWHSINSSSLLYTVNGTNFVMSKICVVFVLTIFISLVVEPLFLKTHTWSTHFLAFSSNSLSTPGWIDWGNNKGWKIKQHQVKHVVHLTW